MHSTPILTGQMLSFAANLTENKLLGTTDTLWIYHLPTDVVLASESQDSYKGSKSGNKLQKSNS